MFLPAAPGSFSLLQALVDGLIPGTWDSALFDSLGAQGRLELYQSSAGCRDWVVLGPQTAAVTVTGYGGIDDAVWQRQMARAEQRLALRGPRRGNKLRVRIPSLNPAALQSVLSIAPAAGSAASVLQVEQLPSSQPACEGVFTPWLHGLPQTFPNLTLLYLDRLCGCLPPAELLPELTKLSVYIVSDMSVGEQPPIDPTPEPTSVILSSIAPYLPQLTSLHVRSTDSSVTDMPLPLLFDRATSTLEEFRTDQAADSQLVKLLCQHACSLMFFDCDTFCDKADAAERQAVSALTWQGQELGLGSASRLRLDSLPRTAGTCLIQRHTWRTTDKAAVYFSVDVEGVQGLFKDMQERLRHIKFEYPSDIMLCFPHEPMSRSDTKRAVDTALRQLSDVLDDWSRIHTDRDSYDWGWEHDEPGRPARKHYLKDLLDWDVFAPGLWPNPNLQLYADCPDSPEPGQVKVRLLHHRVRYEEVLALNEEEMIGGSPCEIDAGDGSGLDLRDLYKSRESWIQKMCDNLKQCTINVQGRFHVKLHVTDIERPFHEEEVDNMRDVYRLLRQRGEHLVLRRALRVLRSLRLHAESELAQVVIQLCGMPMHEFVFSELKGLPVLDMPCTLEFEKCDWYEPDESYYTQLPAIVPSCYTKWAVSGECSAEHILSMCEGAAAARRGMDLICYGSEIGDEDRSRVHKVIDERGWGQWVWVYWSREDMPDMWAF